MKPKQLSLLEKKPHQQKSLDNYLPKTLKEFEDEWIEPKPIKNGLHPYIRKEINIIPKTIENLTLDSMKGGRKLMKKPNEKSKSEFDLSTIPDDHPFEDLRLPPPHQFRDIAPLPPDEFRDPPLPPVLSPPPKPPSQAQPQSKQQSIKNELDKPSVDAASIVSDSPIKLQFPAPSIDNPIYHIYEAVKASNRPPVKKSQSSSELTALAKNLEISPSSTDVNIELTSNEYSTINNDESNFRKSTQQESSPIKLLEFEKCREEFRKQINYSGSIYSDFQKLASELPYFHISDEYRAFSPNGLHLIICVHGLDGNSADLRLVRTYLELGLPGAHLEFLMSERNQGDTFSDFETMTDRLVNEILHHIDACGLNPTRISFVAHSLGTIIVRSALARPQLRPLLSRLHTFLSLSGPHLGTLYNSSGLVNMGELVAMTVTTIFVTYFFLF